MARSATAAAVPDCAPEPATRERQHNLSANSDCRLANAGIFCLLSRCKSPDTSPRILTREPRVCFQHSASVRGFHRQCASVCFSRWPRQPCHSMPRHGSNGISRPHSRGRLPRSDCVRTWAVECGLPGSLAPLLLSACTHSNDVCACAESR